MACQAIKTRGAKWIPAGLVYVKAVVGPLAGFEKTRRGKESIRLRTADNPGSRAGPGFAGAGPARRCSARC